MKLKAGDKVKVRKDLKVGIRYGSSSLNWTAKFVEEMVNHKGRIVTIKNVDIYGPTSGNISICEDSNRYCWVDTMFEEIIANKVPKLGPGIAVYCDTDEKANVFLQECKMQGILSIYKEPAPSLINEWHNRITFAINTTSDSQVLVGYTSKDYLEDKNFENYKVYEFDELFKESSNECNKINEAAVSVVENASKALKETLSKSFKEVVASTPKAPKRIEFIENEKGNVLALLPRYEVLYEKSYAIDKDVKKVMQNGRCIIVILETGEKGVAKCHPDDKFDTVTGYNVAYAKAKIKLSKLKIKYFRKQLHDEMVNLRGYEQYFKHFIGGLND